MSEARKPSQTSSHIPQIPTSSDNSASSTPSPQDGVQKQVRARRRNKKRKRGETNISTTDTPGHTPWLESLGMTEYESKNQRLHDEIVAFVEYMEPTDQERRARELVIARVGDIVKRRFPTSAVTVFGSVAHGLVLPDGDIDLVVQTPQVYEDAYKTRSLFQISSMLKTALITRGGQVAVGARVPVLSFPTVVALGSFNMDISINADDGTKAISVVQDYLTKMPALRPLVFVIKALLSHKGLNSPANGGLGSYAIICLVICFLQINPKGRPLECIQKPLETESLGTLVMDFLDYFGNEFPYSTSYLAAAQGKVLPKESMGWTNEAFPDALSIECLVNPGRDIGKATSRIAQVRSVFQESYTRLVQYPFSMSHGNILGSILSISDKILDHRKHIKHLVDSGSLESDLAAIILPPTWSMPRNPIRSRRTGPSTISPAVGIYSIPYHSSYPTYTGYQFSYPSHGYGTTYLSYGIPNGYITNPAVVLPPAAGSALLEDVHRNKRQRT